MQYIANIITKYKFDTSCYFNISDDYYNVDNSLPTLIIGWEEVKKLFPNQNILDYKISDTISWTFSKREKRHQYEKDINNFITSVVSNLKISINYKFFNYILSSQEKRESFTKYISDNKCSIYYNSKFAYIYIPKDKITLGLSLMDLEYCGINSKDFITRLGNTDKIICSNLNCVDIQSLSLIKDNVKVVAYLNYLKNS